MSLSKKNSDKLSNFITENNLVDNNNSYKIPLEPNNSSKFDDPSKILLKKTILQIIIQLKILKKLII